MLIRYSFQRYRGRNCFKDQQPFTFPHYLAVNEIFHLNDCLICPTYRKKRQKYLLSIYSYSTINLVELEEQEKLLLVFLYLTDRDCNVNLFLLVKKILQGTVLSDRWFLYISTFSIARKSSLVRPYILFARYDGRMLLQ